MYEIELSQLKKSLERDIPFNFSFRKLDGKLRHVTGTLNEKLIPEEFKPKDASTHFNGTNFKYFDLEKNAWRSLRKDCKTVKVILVNL